MRRAARDGAAGRSLELLPRRDERAQRVQRTELDAADRAVALADELRDRLRVVAFDVAEDEDLLLERRELLHRFADRACVRAGEETLIGVHDLVGVPVRQRVLQSDLLAVSAAAASLPYTGSPHARSAPPESPA